MHLNISWLHSAKHGSFMDLLDCILAKSEPEMQEEQVQEDLVVHKR
jgi:hypothetical protein